MLLLFSCRAVRDRRCWEAEQRYYRLQGVDTLVDIGSGNGGLSLDLAHRYPQLFFVLEDVPDTNGRDKAYWISRLWKDRPSAPRLSQRYRYVTGSADSIPLPAASYRRILCRKTFHEFTNREAMVRELHRILAPGGVLTVVEFLPGKRQIDPYCKMPYVNRAEVLAAFSGFRLRADTLIRYHKASALLMDFVK